MKPSMLRLCFRLATSRQSTRPPGPPRLAWRQAAAPGRQWRTDGSGAAGDGTRGDGQAGACRGPEIPAAECQHLLASGPPSLLSIRNDRLPGKPARPDDIAASPNGPAHGWRGARRKAKPGACCGPEFPAVKPKIPC
jgi:hypothetical protein